MGLCGWAKQRGSYEAVVATYTPRARATKFFRLVKLGN
jgi:hypothetical protein